MMEALDVEALRAETPGCSAVTHFNHASCSLPPSIVTDTIIGHLSREALLGPSEMGLEAAPKIQEARRAAASLIGASADEIALVGSGSQGWGMAFAGLPPLRHGDRILVGRAEWGGNLSTLTRAAHRAGATIEAIPCAEDGTTSPEAMAAMLDARVRLVALTWCPATNGLINPAAEIGRVARAAGVPFFIDAGQALGQLPVDVERLGCDVLKGAGRKALRGPRGTAILYVRRGFIDALEPPYLDVLSGPWTDGGPAVRSDARRFETSENPFALQLGLGAAIARTLEIGVPAIRDRIARVSRALRDALDDIPKVTVHDVGSERSSIVTFSVAGLSATMVKAALAEDRINVAAIAATYAPLDMAAHGLGEVVRASVSYLTTEDEIGELVEAVHRLALGSA